MTFDRTPKARMGRLATFAAAAALLAGPAFAQTTPAPKPAAPKPAAPAAPAPAQPAQPVPAPGAPAAQLGPSVVQVKPEPTQTDWLKVCGKDQGAGKEICYTTRDFVSDQGLPVLAIAVYDVKGEPQKVIRFLMPQFLLLQPGIRFAADSSKPEQGRFAICTPTGCFADAQVKDDVVAAFKKGTTLNIVAQNQFAREVTFQVPLAGFGKVYEGAATDLAAIEQMNKDREAAAQKMQEQLQQEAEKMRQQQGGVAPAPVPAPAPAKP